MRPYKRAADIGNVQITESRFDINGGIIWKPDGEIYVADLPLGIVAKQIYHYHARKVLRRNNGRGLFDIGGNIYQGAVPTDHRYSTGTICQLKPNVLARRVIARKLPLRRCLAAKEDKEKNYA